MADYYTVEQGDHLSKIARDFGFTDYTILWNHPNNADLKKKRQSPNILFPGDQIFVPDMEQKHESGATDKRHTFTVDAKPLKLCLVLEDQYEKPIGGAQCALRVKDLVTQPTTSADGKIEQDIPPDADKAFLVVRSDETPYQNVLLVFKIGDLDPLDEVSGQVARLNNLGYFAGQLDGSDDDAFASAIQEFQCDFGLVVDGICGPRTQAKLKQVHGS